MQQSNCARFWALKFIFHRSAFKGGSGVFAEKSLNRFSPDIYSVGLTCRDTIEPFAMHTMWLTSSVLVKAPRL